MPAEVILVIEDDAHIGGLVVQVLRAARDWGNQGNKPAAVLSDLMVAGSSGPAQLPAELSAIFIGAPLALMTGVPPRRRAALGVTHERIIEKPFELEALIATVAGMLAAPRP